jgi:hypothetical protein
MSGLMSDLMSGVKSDMPSRNLRWMGQLQTKMSGLNARIILVVLVVLVVPIPQVLNIIHRWSMMLLGTPRPLRGKSRTGKQSSLKSGPLCDPEWWCSAL